MSGEESEIKFIGMMGIQDVVQVKADLDKKIDAPVLTINLEGIDLMDATVAQCIYAAMLHRQANGLETQLDGVNEFVRETVEGMGLLEAFGED